jgi:hypothetical protein
MNMNRRHVIRVALVGTVTLVAGGPVDVLAAQGGALIPAQLGPLDLFFDFNWDVALESAAVAFVKSLFGQFTASVGRRWTCHRQREYPQEPQRLPLGPRPHARRQREARDDA